MNIQNHTGLNIEFLENGAVKCIKAGSIRISMRESSPFSEPGVNIFLRKHTDTIEFITLTGPHSTGVFRLSDKEYVTQGSWEGVEYTCVMQLSEKSKSWQWNIHISNNTGKEARFDLVCVQDVGLKAADSGTINEYYVSQYIERLILEDEKLGTVICCRQNMKEKSGHPWLMMACKKGALSGLTDGMQFYGKSYRVTGIPESLLSEKFTGEYAGESSVIALQGKPFTLKSGESYSDAFVFSFLANHTEATSTDDLKRLPGILQEISEEFPEFEGNGWQQPVTNLFVTAPLLPSEEFNSKELDTWFGTQRRHEETENGKVFSFFCNEHDHVVLKAKELLTDRPHGHIIQANSGLKPDEAIMSTNPYAFGVFNSHITQGNTNFNILLSVCSGQFNLVRETGQRIFVSTGNETWLLGVPSAFEMGLNHCRWIYKFGEHIIQVRTWTDPHSPNIHTDVKVLEGGEIDLILTHQFDPLNSWKIIQEQNGEIIARPAQESMIISKFPEAQFKILLHGSNSGIDVQGAEALYDGNLRKADHSLLVFKVKNATNFTMSFVGEVTSPAKTTRIEDTDQQFRQDCREATLVWKKLSQNLTLKGNHKDITAIGEIIPWYGMNALIHYLTPYGLEQFGGAAWGTRDVSQGPIDLLLYLGKYDEARQVLCTIFSNQNPDGGWPQWWMFDSYSEIRAHEAHGDIIYWCIIALSQYINMSGDVKILNEALLWYSENDEKSEKSSLAEHVEKLIGMIVSSFIPGTSLVPFGGGDWNDSLQPVSEDLASRMISSWTVEMNYQAFRQYTGVYEATGNHAKANELNEICEKIKSDFNKYLVKDGVVAGYGLAEKHGSISVLLHPTDTTTGIKYSVLPMNRGIISGIFSPEQAEKHQHLVERHLKGPDGARLMDQPLPYKGGIQEIFQRAESSTYFGREIGLMYIHEHIRYAESLAIMGKPEAFVKALRQAIPVEYRDIVSCGDIRQANCYYSSSDVIFKSRYDADQRYQDVIDGKMTLRGGWRVYSSGPGIFIGLIVSRLLGIRTTSENIVLDPVMPYSFNGLTATTEFFGKPVEVSFKAGHQGFGVRSVMLNGNPLNSEPEENPYREGGVMISREKVISLLKNDANKLEIEIK
jgi:1,2-beta-oligoglucan phosphorylase